MTVVATLIVVRPRGSLLDRARTYEILVDGVAKGRLRAGRELALAVAPGAHTVQARRGTTAGPQVRVHVGPGAQTRVRTGSGLHLDTTPSE